MTRLAGRLAALLLLFAALPRITVAKRMKVAGQAKDTLAGKADAFGAIDAAEGEVQEINTVVAGSEAAEDDSEAEELDEAMPQKKPLTSGDCCLKRNPKKRKWRHCSKCPGGEFAKETPDQCQKNVHWVCGKEQMQAVPDDVEVTSSPKGGACCGEVAGSIKKNKKLCKEGCPLGFKRVADTVCSTKRQCRDSKWQAEPVAEDPDGGEEPSALSKENDIGADTESDVTTDEWKVTDGACRVSGEKFRKNLKKGLSLTECQDMVSNNLDVCDPKGWYGGRKNKCTCVLKGFASQCEPIESKGFQLFERSG